jgi:hypothetical protein
VKSGCAGAVTTSVTDVVCVSEPLVPVIVNGYVPAGVVALVATVNVDVVVVGFGLNEPVAPDGRPDTPSDTEPVKPFCGFTVTV